MMWGLMYIVPQTVERRQVTYKDVGFDVHCYSDCTEEVSYLQGCEV